MVKDIRTWQIGFDKVRISDEHEAEAKKAERRKLPGRFRSWVLRRLGRQVPINQELHVKGGTYSHQRSVHRPEGS
jgi:hypothetical protein